MPSPDAQPPAPASSPAQPGVRNPAPPQPGVRDPSSGAPVGQAAGSSVSELLGVAQDTASAMLEAEQALRVVRERFERTEDPGARGELAAEALDQIERQLQLTRQRRQELEGIEGRLWARRNRLERFLIHTRGLAWWHAHRDAARAELLASSELQ